MVTARTLIRKVKKLAILLTTPLGRHGLLQGVAMTTEHIPAMRTLTPSVILDVGANKGQFSLLCRQMFPDARIIAFEPLHSPATKFRRLFDKESCVELHQCAIGHTSGTGKIHISRQEDSSSLLPIGQTQSEVFPGTESVGTQDVDIRLIEDFFDAGDMAESTLLKIDVQGFELQVLKGCGNVLDSIDWCYIECSYVELYTGQALVNQIVEFLGDHHFHLSGVFGQHFNESGVPVQADFLFSASK